MGSEAAENTPGRKVKVALKNALGFRGIKRVRILAGPARGVTMTLDFSGHTPMYLGMFEWELHSFFRAALAGAEVVFDVGGYVGYDALMFAANSPGRVITFEPDPDRVRTIQCNLGDNPLLQPRISVNPRAIGLHDGPGTAKLDTITSSVGIPDFIKIDIDGGELDALIGGRRLLRERHPHLVVETHSLELENNCGAFLAECGYRPIIKHNRRIWREHRAGAAHNRWLLAPGRPATT